MNFCKLCDKFYVFVEQLYLFVYKHCNIVI